MISKLCHFNSSIVIKHLKRGSVCKLLLAKVIKHKVRHNIQYCSLDVDVLLVWLTYNHASITILQHQDGRVFNFTLFNVAIERVNTPKTIKKTCLPHSRLPIFI